MIFHQAFTLNPFQENTYIIWDENGTGIIVDPGCYTYEERQTLKAFIEEKNITLTHILNTHAHIDHVLGVEYFRQEFKIPFYLHPKDEPLLKDAANRAQVYGFPHYQPSEVDVWYEDNQVLNIGEMEIKILFVPGHAPGHVALYFEKEGLLFDGDVLFRRSVGRTDFPMCNHADLVKSIQTQLYTLPDSTIVYPGHGGSTTIGEEKSIQSLRKSMKKEIPNLLTLGNLLAGCIGLWFVMQGDLVSASYCIFISLICDFFDGFLARALQAYSDLGKELDSLADMVSFGVLPAFILFSLVEQSCGTQCTVGLFGFYKPFMVFALALMSAYRLAKFNIDTRQSDQFIGVPTPANGLLIASLPLILHFQPEYSAYILSFKGLLIYAVVMSYLLVCELPLLAFKFKTWDWKSNQVKFIFLIFCIAALVMLKFAAIPVLVIAYILLSGLIFLLNPNK